MTYIYICTSIYTYIYIYMNIYIYIQKTLIGIRMYVLHTHMILCKSPTLYSMNTYSYHELCATKQVDRHTDVCVSHVHT